MFRDLSSNNFSGNLPKSLGDLSKLSTLHLQNNKLSGPVNVLANIHLSDLNIANNKFGGSIPKEFSSISNLRIEGNAFNNHLPPASHNHGHNNHAPSQRGSNVQNSQDGHFKHAGMGAPIICLISGVIVIALCTIMATLFCLRNKSKSNGVAEPKQKNNTTSISIGKDKGEWHQFSDYISSHAPTEWSFRPKELSSTQPSSSYQTEVTSKGTPEKTKHETSMADLKPPPGEKTLAAAKSYWGNESGNRAIKVPISATSYTVAALQSATNSFSQEYLIGEGSLGRVYKAEFSNGKVLAVKKIDCSSYIQEEDTFLETISSISKLKHQNITSLLGYCVEHGQRLLVYEYIGNGTLHDVLHYGDVHSEVISWTSRVKVALGTARALEYLHEVCLPSIVHKNLKSANVLLDEELNPHLSDCGLAVSMSNPERQVLTQAVGSFGYSAPEFVLSGVYTVNSDVYSLGVLMLELLTGRKPLDSSRVRSEQSLVRWAIPQLHDIDALSKMVDPLLNGIYPAKSLSQFADIVALCVQTEPEFRPPMSEVVQSLVRLAQKASIVKRLSGDELGFSHKILEFDQTGISTHI
ncbi:Protein STRUBBELIG-RECEPTOR FAMILY 8 [Zostera marina]|uniref:Protein STRUBBELIG-RECEPTOR FAMILY 8 n=1 Tax=Zostera marina TaxID=29655 RepID=A0A0K9NY00_ZOSMR|nr:Protein STRUBBELIG-RECEPTOR FAMILY 8 [Zostera marina]